MFGRRVTSVDRGSEETQDRVSRAHPDGQGSLQFSSRDRACGNGRLEKRRGNHKRFLEDSMCTLGVRY